MSERTFSKCLVQPFANCQALEKSYQADEAQLSSTQSNLFTFWLQSLFARALTRVFEFESKIRGEERSLVSFA